MTGRAEAEDILGEIARSLRAKPPRLPSRLHYDAVGARLFEAIYELDEYYLPRVERGIMEECLEEIARTVGPRAVIVEPGAGAATKTERLLKGLVDPAQWVPIDVASGQLDESAARLAKRFPSLAVDPIAGDWTKILALPAAPPGAGARVVFFPGSSIGNFHPPEAVEFLKRMAALSEYVLVGVDLEKDPLIIERAYDDPQGVTAAFSRNLLAHVNAITGAGFDVRSWRHRARWNATAHRNEAHLIAERAQKVMFGGETFSFEEGDQLLVECSYKYTRDRFAELASNAGLSVTHRWADPRAWFSVALLERS